jgi:hypothetical protein
MCVRKVPVTDCRLFRELCKRDLDARAIATSFNHIDGFRDTPGIGPKGQIAIYQKSEATGIESKDGIPSIAETVRRR